MPVRSGALARLGRRLGERRDRAGRGEMPALTEADEQSIAQFTVLVTQMQDLLNREYRALIDGNVDEVAGYAPPKQDLLKRMELRQPVIEPLFKAHAAQAMPLRQQITELTQSLQRNGRLLKGMADASRAILSELERLKLRRSLDGLYDNRGRLRRGLGSHRRKFQRDI